MAGSKDWQAISLVGWLRLSRRVDDTDAMRKPPAADDDDAYVWVDHREEEVAIVELIAERLDEGDALTWREDGENLFVSYAGKEHRLPLTLTPHDRYVVISSLAALLAERYRFFLHKERLEDDTHGICVARASDVAAWGGVPAHLMSLELGVDYFSPRAMRVPYLRKLDNNPNFAVERDAERSEREEAGRNIDAWLKDQFEQDPQLRRALDSLKSAGRPWWKFW